MPARSQDSTSPATDAGSSLAAYVLSETLHRGSGYFESRGISKVSLALATYTPDSGT